MKLATTEVQIKRIPSADNRPWTFVVTSSTAWVCGLIRRYVALAPSHCSTCESNTKIAIRRENNTAGCGTAFPTRSTVSRARFIRVLVAPVDPLMIRSLVGGAFNLIAHHRSLPSAARSRDTVGRNFLPSSDDPATEQLQSQRGFAV